VDVPELLGLAVDLVPPSARSDAGLGGDAVRGYLRENEWEVALSVLEDFDGIQWQTAEYWDLLADAAQHMGLGRNAAWCQWRRRETLHGVVRADLQLLAPQDGGRHSPIPGDGVLRPMWAIDRDGGGLHIAVIWVESAAEITPGGRGAIRLAPLTPADWHHLTSGDVITMHERQPVVGTATITEIRHPAE
jgi:hypothetical protein